MPSDVRYHHTYLYEAFFRLSILAYEELIQLVDLALAEAAEQTVASNQRGA
jgi:hypothetical protein